MNFDRLEQVCRKMSQDIYESSIRTGPRWVLDRVFVHDFAARLLDYASLKSMGAGVVEGRSTETVQTVVASVGRRIWKRSRILHTSAPTPRRSHSEIRAEPGGVAIIVDWSRHREAENAILANALCDCGIELIDTGLSTRSRLRATVRVLIFMLFHRRSRQRALRWLERNVESLRGLAEFGLRAEDVLPHLRAIAVNYCIVDMMVAQAIRESERRGSRLMVISRSGGYQVSSFVNRRRRDAAAVKSVLAVHSSATGASLPEAAVVGDLVLVRSWRQAENLTVQASHSPIIRVVGRLTSSSQVPHVAHQRTMKCLLALTQRRVHDLSLSEREALIALWDRLLEISHETPTIRIKPSASARKDFQEALPGRMRESLSLVPLEDDLRRHSLAIVIPWAGYLSTVLQDAVNAGVPVVNTALNCGDTEAAVWVNPTGRQRSSFISFDVLMRSSLEDLIQAAADAEAAHSDAEAEAPFDLDAFRSAIKELWGTERMTP